MLPIHEFILWNNCSNNCKFCWQKLEKQQTYEEQLNSITLVARAVEKLKDTHVLFVGGEIFDGKDAILNGALFKLFELTLDKMQKGDIELLYINTNILYNIDRVLLPVLKKISDNNMLHRVHFTTSGDNYGRFNKVNNRDLFYANLEQIRSLYTDLPIYVNIILTNNFCDDVLSDKFNILEYEKTLNVEVNTIPYIKFGKVIHAPTRQKVWDTILHLNEQMPGYGVKYCNNFLLNQNIVLQKYYQGNIVNISSNKSVCKHSENFKRCYADSDECFVCDCAKLKALMEG